MALCLCLIHFYYFLGVCDSSSFSLVLYYINLFSYHTAWVIHTLFPTHLPPPIKKYIQDEFRPNLCTDNEKN